MLQTDCRLETLNVKEIDHGIRGREDYKDIVGLATSIKERGLIHPIAVCDHPLVEGKYLLLAGGRRLRAHEFAGLEKIDCKIFPADLTELEIKTIELTENLYREDLTPVEELKMKQEIVRIMEQLHGRKTSTAPDAPGVSKTDIAKMMGVSHASLSQDLKAAETMAKFPDVDWTKCKNKAEVKKLQDNIINLVVRHDAVKRFEETVKRSPNNGLDLLSKSYIVGDFFEKVQQIPSNSMQFVEIDPPYAIDLASKKAKTGMGDYIYGEGGYNEIERNAYSSFMRRVFEECYRVMSNNSFLVCWYSPDPWHQPIISWLRRAGFVVRGLPCVWIKGKADDEGLADKTTGQTMTPMRHLGSACEHFFYARKGDPVLNKMGRNNVFSYKPVPAKQKVHPTERPLALIEELIDTFSPVGGRILVPFAGSGKTLIAAHRTKRFAVGFDIGESHREGFIELLQREEVL